jgi:hypothetical protein
MANEDPPGFERHPLRLTPGAVLALPGTPYGVGLADAGVARRDDEDGNVVVSCQLVVHEDGERVHTELVLVGETAWFRDLEVNLLRADDDDGVHVEVTRAPYTSIPPKPAR